MKINNQTFDVIAFTSSILCAIHCAALPLILSFSTLGSLQFLQNPWIEWTFIMGGLLMANVTLIPSFKNIHKCSAPLVFAFSGFFFIGLGRLDFAAWWETVNTVLGAFLVSYAHYRNWKLLKDKHHSH